MSGWVWCSGCAGGPEGAGLGWGRGGGGIGKPEALKHGFQGYWSRRITDEHRLVHKIAGACCRACRYVAYGKTITAIPCRRLDSDSVE
ncbi:MAG: type II toxin-antitoxin system YoeB family toxin [Haloechinothrix sp.]